MTVRNKIWAMAVNNSAYYSRKRTLENERNYIFISIAETQKKIF
jgi:hypothetical protein